MADETRLEATEEVESQLHQLQQLAMTTRETLMDMIRKQDEQGKLLQERKQAILDMKRSSEEWQTRMDQTMTQMGEWMRALSQEVDRQFNLEEAPILAMGNRWPWGMDASFGVVNGNQIGFPIVDEHFLIDEGKQKSKWEGIDQITKSSGHGGQPANIEARIVKGSPRIVDRKFKEPSGSVLGDSGAEVIDNRVSKIENPNQTVLDFASIDELRDWEVEVEAPAADTNHVGAQIANTNLEFQIQGGSERDDAKKPPNSEILGPLKVKSDPFETPPVNYTAENLGDLVVLLVELMEIRLVSAKNVSGNGLRIDSIASLRNLMSAHKVFVKMPTRTSFRADALGLNFSRFKPRIDEEFGIEQGPMANSWPYDRGKGVLIVNTSSLLDCGMEGVGFKLLKSCVESSRVVIDGDIDSELEDERSDSISLPYDRGKKLLRLKFKGVQVDLWAMVFVFYPGGSGIPNKCCHKM